MSGATSSSVRFTAAVPSAATGFSGQPNSVVAGDNLGTVSVQILDSLGNPSTSNLSVTLSLQGAPYGTQLFGTTTVKAVNGVATFTDLSVTQAGSGFSLVATSPGLTSGGSATFSISAAEASGLSFQQQPTATPTGNDIAPAVTVDVVDQYGNLIINSQAAVTLTLEAGTNSGRLSRHH